MRTRLVILAAAVLAAAFLLVVATLPAEHRTLPAAVWQPASPTVAGAIHVHTHRSDGSGSPDEVAAAAARAGLQFLVLTDHGDGTRTPDAPIFRSGVLCLDAVEISTTQGHYVALGLPQTPYPLAGEPRDVVADVARLGGFGIAAHPDSASAPLQWRDWAAPFDGIEWLNADSEWRNESAGRLARTLITYPFRPVEALGLILDRPDTTLQRWDRLTQQRRVVAFAGSDAHARLGWQDNDADGYTREWFLRLPSYEASFRTFAMHAVLARPFSGDPSADAAQLIAALRGGRVFTGIDAMATPAAFEFTATARGERVEQGDRIEPGAPVTFRARTNAITDGAITLLRNGAIVAQHALPELTFTGEDSGVYRVEVTLDRASGHPPSPWIVSNPIYVEPAGWGAIATAPVKPAPDFWPIQGGPWHDEQGGGSVATVATVTPPTGPVSLTFRLAEGPRAGQYAALVMSAGNALTGHERLSFRAQASSPMRISVQARRPRGDRWQRSVYLDTTEREVIVRYDDMMPVAPTTAPHFDPRDVDTVLFVADTTNTAPGSGGRFEVQQLRVEH